MLKGDGAGGRGLRCDAVRFSRRCVQLRSRRGELRGVFAGAVRIRRSFSFFFLDVQLVERNKRSVGPKTLSYAYYSSRVVVFAFVCGWFLWWCAMLFSSYFFFGFSLGAFICMILSCCMM